MSSGRSTVTLPSTVAAGDVTLEITAVEPRVTLDRRYAEPVVLPAAISEISAGRQAGVPAAFETGCRDDLLAVDGEPVSVRVGGTTAAALAGDALDVTVCDGDTIELDAGTHRITTGTGALSGLDVDRVVLAAPGPSVATHSRADGNRHRPGPARPRGDRRGLSRRMLAGTR